MKKLLFTIITALLAATNMAAEVQSPYTEQFENPSFRPVGWKNILSSSYSPGTYTVCGEGGHSGGYISVKQYSSYFSSYYKNYSYSDLLATPKVSGEVSIWVRKNGTEPALTFYKLSDQNTVPSSYSAPVLVEGTEINMVEGVNVDSWTKITVPGVADGTYIGIRAHDLDLDEFTATTADVTPFKLLYCKVDNQSGTTINANPDNTYTINFKVTMENAGDVDFGGNAPVTVEVINNVTQSTFGSGEITGSLPRGVKIEKEFSITGTHVTTDDVKAYSYSVVLSHPDMSSFNGSLGSIIFVPYLPAPKFMYNEGNDANQNNFTDVDATEFITIGSGASPSRTLWMWNSGIAEMEVTSTTLSGGFVADVNAFSLAPGEKKAVRISAASGAGLKEGVVTFTEKNLGDITYGLQALVTEAGKFFEDFEAEQAPAGWIFGNPWKLGAVPESLAANGATQSAESSYASSKGMLITPKLRFAADERIYFSATKKDNTSSLLTVYTSTDRIDWTPVMAVNARPEEGQAIFGQDKPTGTGYGTYEFSIFSAPMPEGECYVAFEAGGVLLDNVYGGEKVAVDHDLYVTALSTPKDGVGSVNARYISSVTVRNLLTEEENDYKVALYFDDTQIAVSPETGAIGAGEEMTFEIVATPHVEGAYTATIAFISGEASLPLAVFDAEIGPEKAEATYQVGDEKITNTDPFNTGYAGVQTQIIYKADMLQMEKGMKITGVYFTGANSNAISKHIKVWAENTTDIEYPERDIQPAPVADMTLVYDSDYEFPIAGDTGAKIYEPVLHIVFDTPFEYTGNNLRLAFELIGGEEGGYGSNVMFMVDNTGYDYYNDKYNHYAIVNKQRYSEDLEDEASWTLFRAGFPASFFTVAKDVVVVKGNVVDDFGSAVESAHIALESGDILYTSFTDASGAYRMNVANVSLTYTLTATADDFDRVVRDNIVLNARQPETTVDLAMSWTDRTAVLSGHVYSVSDNEPAAGVEISLSNGDEKVAAVTDGDGAYSLEVSELARPYAVTITQDGIVRYSNVHTFASRNDVENFYIVYSGICGVAADGDMEAEYFNLQGVKVAQPVPGNVYIRRQAGRTEKVTVK